MLEYGGRLIDDERSQAMYIVQEDGYQRDIWNLETTDNDGKEKSMGNVIHERFIDECIKERSLLRSSVAMHLQPLPHMVPIKSFSQACVQLALIES